MFRCDIKQVNCTYNHGNEWILELLVLHLSVDVNSRQPASITRMRVVPSNGVLQATNLMTEPSTIGHVSWESFQLISLCPIILKEAYIQGWDKMT